MPYNSSGAFNLLPGTYGLPNTTIKSGPYNAAVDDFAQAINTPRPISGGGTGATNAEDALENLGGIRTADVDAIFVGVVVPFPMTTPPAGWLICNGQAVSRVTYARLFALLGLTWGAGDGATTFNLPDLRGMFIRGWDNGRGVDPARICIRTR
ncbi:MAG: tail fiber protein [Rhizobiaceae bacterium]